MNAREHPPSPFPPSEIGRELRADELKKGVVYVLYKPGHWHCTMWASDLDPWPFAAALGLSGELKGRYIAFYSGLTRVTFLARKLSDGGLADDSNTRIFVYEYLGEQV